MKLPDVAAGKVVPHAVKQLEQAEARAKAAERKVKMQFWISIAVSLLSVFIGWLLGKFL